MFGWFRGCLVTRLCLRFKQNADVTRLVKKKSTIPHCFCVQNTGKRKVDECCFLRTLCKLISMNSGAWLSTVHANQSIRLFYLFRKETKDRKTKDRKTYLITISYTVHVNSVASYMWFRSDRSKDQNALNQVRLSKIKKKLFFIF